ncbi:hypothetical protein BCD49_28600 [Pseudofrankia sp. EUN1h]|nr:hypothetical protein BCD49_28600 [Pseudofrankia sp. EUN1h]
MFRSLRAAHGRQQPFIGGCFINAEQVGSDPFGKQSRQEEVFYPHRQEFAEITQRVLRQCG